MEQPLPVKLSVRRPFSVKLLVKRPFPVKLLVRHPLRAALGREGGARPPVPSSRTLQAVRPL
ncbi:hypothetical protein Misp02_15580 [Microtetraspora sp. NBRC 16547]|nr:hypothetical protein Misp02_15580 [Microtetraspora sp. NBRC 16547]